MPKIAHFLSFGIGGADRAAIELVRCLVQKGLDITILYNEMSFPRRTSDQDENQPLLSIFNEAKKLAPHLRINSTEEIEKLGFDLLHTHRSGEDEWLLPGLGKNPRTYKIVETNFHGATETIADMRIYPSRALMQSRKLALGDESSIIPNIVNSKRGTSQRSEYGISEETLVFGRVGRSDKSIYSSKLIEEYAKIETKETLLIWVGKSRLAELDALKFGLNNIMWLDPIEDPTKVADLYQTFDVYLHVNALGETFGNTVAEAVLRGIPVASLKGDRRYPQAQAELLVDKQYCSSRRQFRNLLNTYLRNPERRREISSLNLDFSKNNLSEESIFLKVKKVYEEILN
jgi:glycosyltransferase involved in cell wall biosynthesis